jgi:hypothetical protein
MGRRSLLLALATLSSVHVADANAQSVYVAPGGVYIGGGPVYVTPAPSYNPTPYAAPTYGYGYGPPAAVAPAPPIVAPTTAYGPYGTYYDAPYDTMISAYAAEPVPRPPAPVPYYGTRHCPYGGWPPC